VSRLIRAVIDTRALRSNLRTVRARAPGARVMAVVKANAYGHGLVPTALALAALAGPLVALYMLRSKRRERRVASVMFGTPQGCTPGGSTCTGIWQGYSGLI